MNNYKQNKRIKYNILLSPYILFYFIIIIIYKYCILITYIQTDVSEINRPFKEHKSDLFK